MRKTVLTLALAAQFGAAAIAQAPGSGTTPDPNITKIADAYVKATLAGDANAIAALYTEDAVEMPPNQPAVKGRAAILAYYEKQLSDPSMKISAFSLDHLETTSEGGVGYDVGTYRQTMTGGKAPMNDTGKFVVLLKKNGGQWRVAYAIYNSDQPPMPMGKTK